MRIPRVRLQFGLGALAIVVAISTSLAWHYNSRSWPEIPWGTDRELAAAMYDAFANPPSLYAVVRPGWADLHATPEMRGIAKFGDNAIPVLVANISNQNQLNRLQVYELLAMVDAESAVPDLIKALRYDDGVDDAFIIAKLAEITDHQDGYRFYREWFDKEVQQEATEAYRRWYAERQ